MTMSPALKARRAELERLEFKIVDEYPKKLVAVGSRFYWDCAATKLVYTIFVRELPALTEDVYDSDRARLEEEAAALDPSALPRGMQKGNAVIVFYLADEVDPRVEDRIETKPERGFAKFHFAVAYDKSTDRGIYLRSTPMWGALYYGKFRHFAERLLHPEEPPTRAPLSCLGVAIALMIVVPFLFLAALAIIDP